MNITKNKYDFIQELLEKKNLSSFQKERLFKLVSKEIKNDTSSNEEILRRIRIIEEKIGEPREAQGKIFINKHTPQEMVKFLDQFSKNDNLKWFTHEGCPLPFDYDSRISKAQQLLPKYPKISINYKTYSNIRNFLFEVKNKEGIPYPCWVNGNKIIKYTWSDIKDWCHKNSNKTPFKAEINGDSFLLYINRFKHVIEFRTDNPDLIFLKRFKKFIRKNIAPDFTTSYTKAFKNKSKTLSAYIDTNLLFKGLTQIIDWINKNKAKSNELEINLDSSNPEYYQLEIFHKNSYFSLSPDNPKIKGIQGDFDMTRKNLFCVADWTIQADFKYDNISEHYKIICLDSNTTIKNTIKKGNNEQRISENVFEKIDTKVGGVKHILKLYKTI